MGNIITHFSIPERLTPHQRPIYRAATMAGARYPDHCCVPPVPAGMSRYVG